MTATRDDIIAIITAAHVNIARPGVTADDLRDIAAACADAIVDDTPPGGMVVGAKVRKAEKGSLGLVGVVLSLASTDGELHTVRVRWPDGFAWLYHPSELEVVA